MKKLTSVIIALVIILTEAAACAGGWVVPKKNQGGTLICDGPASYERSGSFYAPITAAFCNGQQDKYAFWTQNAEQAAMLAILICEDFKRQNYSDYNACFPYSSLSCVTFNTGNHADRDVHAIYMCGDACLIACYEADSGQVRYWIDRQYPEVEEFVHHYVAKANNGYHQKIYWNMDISMDFPEPVSSYEKAITKWNKYLEQHPELNFSSAGW